MVNWLVQSVNAHCSPCVPPNVTYRILKTPARATDLTLTYSWASSLSKLSCHVQLIFVGPGLFSAHACSDALQIRIRGMTRCELPLPWRKNKYDFLKYIQSSGQSCRILKEIKKTPRNCVFPCECECNY